MPRRINAVTEAASANWMKAIGTGSITRFQEPCPAACVPPWGSRVREHCWSFVESRSNSGGAKSATKRLFTLQGRQIVEDRACSCAVKCQRNAARHSPDRHFSWAVHADIASAVYGLVNALRRKHATIGRGEVG